ncbi:MAG: GAF domain-containing protein, partial [Armatimonadetes bacterium]|nr:GAF domain-containing protein [Anaerolineae bacterium]
MNQKNATVLVITPHDADFTTMAELLGGFFHHVERHTQLPPINSNHPPFLLIMDYTLRAESWRIYQEQGCAVLLLIPEHDDAALAYALEYSFDDYLTTPIDLRVLAHRIRRLNDLARLYSAEAAEFTQRAMVSALQETALALSSTLDLDTVFDRILIHLAIVLPYDLADVMLVEGGIARVARHRGYVENGLGDQIRQFRLKADHFPNWRTMAETAQPVIIEDIGQHDDWVVGILHEIDYITGSYLGAPFFVNGVLGGFLNLNSRQAGTYTPQLGALLEAFASQVSVALTNAHLHEEVTHHSVELEQRIRDLMVVYHTGQA